MASTEHSEVRLAATNDEEALLDLMNEWHSENGIGRFEPDRARVVVKHGIERHGGVIGVIRGGHDAVEASIGLFIGASWYSGDPHLVDLWSFVSEPYRRSTHAKALILFAKQAAVELSLPLVMTVVGNEQTERKELLYERQLPRGGSLFILQPDAALQSATP